MKRNIAVILMIVIFAVGCSSKSSEELIQEYTKNAEAVYEPLHLLVIDEIWEKQR